MGESENAGQQPKAEEAEVTAAAAEPDAAAGQSATSDPGIKYQGGPTQEPASSPDIKYQG